MRTSDSPCAIDANVILRYLVGNHEELSPRAKTIIESVEDGHLVVWCEPVTLAEVVWVLTSFYNRERAEIGSRLSSIVKLEGFRVAHKALYLRALELYAGPVADFGDACACAAALQHCEGRLLSFDQALSRVEGITRAETPPLGEEAE